MSHKKDARLLWNKNIFSFLFVTIFDLVNDVEIYYFTAYSSLYRLCIVSTSCNRSHVATKKQKKKKKKHSKIQTNQRTNGPLNWD